MALRETGSRSVLSHVTGIFSVRISISLFSDLETLSSTNSVVYLWHENMHRRARSSVNGYISCIFFLQSGRKVVCGTGDGILNLFTWGEWGDITDRFPGHPLSIDSCVAVSDNIVCTGSMDGIIRWVAIPYFVWLKCVTVCVYVTQLGDSTVQNLVVEWSELSWWLN